MYDAYCIPFFLNFLWGNSASIPTYYNGLQARKAAAASCIILAAHKNGLSRSWELVVMEAYKHTSIARTYAVLQRWLIKKEQSFCGVCLFFPSLSPPKLRFEGFCTVKLLTFVVRVFFIYVYNDITIFHFMGFITKRKCFLISLKRFYWNAQCATFALTILSCIYFNITALAGCIWGLYAQVVTIEKVYLLCMFCSILKQNIKRAPSL